VLTIDLVPLVADHPAYNEFDVHANLGQLAPGPQRKVLAVAAAQSLEGAGMLPEIPLVKELQVSDVLAGL